MSQLPARPGCLQMPRAPTLVAPRLSQVWTPKTRRIVTPHQLQPVQSAWANSRLTSHDVGVVRRCRSPSSAAGGGDRFSGCMHHMCALARLFVYPPPQGFRREACCTTPFISRTWRCNSGLGLAQQLKHQLLASSRLVSLALLRRELVQSILVVEPAWAAQRGRFMSPTKRGRKTCICCLSMLLLRLVGPRSRQNTF